LAKPDEAGLLTRLAMRSTASWGYSAEFIEARRAELTMTPATMSDRIVSVAEVDGAIRGMVALALKPESRGAELENLFVDPDAKGRGIGRALISSVLETCRTHGVETIGLDADPFAEPIYRRWGFRTVGRSPSGSIPGRTLPRMELRLR
jgi:GNAT superfamily N-acetyltransferase